MTVTPIKEMAKLTITSTPEGATVLGPDGTDLGKTPVKLEWPISDQPVSFTLKLRGYRDSKKSVTVTSNTMIPVELLRLQAKTNANGNGKGSGETGNGLIRPDDL